MASAGIVSEVCMTNHRTEVAILGAGFAGSLCALLLAQQGREVVLIDKGRHPRFAIGESSTPVGNMVLRDLAEAYDLPWLAPLSTYGTWKAAYPQLRVGRKRGFSYFYHTLGQPFATDAGHSRELLVAASSDDHRCDTHWYRADVDAFLVEQARAAGLAVWEETTCKTLSHEGHWRLSLYGPGGPMSLEARLVIDATGPGQVVSRALGLGSRADDFETCSRALYSHMEGLSLWEDVVAQAGGIVADHPFPCDHAALHHVFDGGWMWMLRFDDGVVSAGLVLDAQRHPLDHSVAPEDEWHQWLARLPSLQAHGAASSWADPPGRLIRTGRLQRRMGWAVGDGWAVLPHTYGFVDPLHSTGIAHTLVGVERLTALLKQHWGKPTLVPALGHHEHLLAQEVSLIDHLVAACYAAGASCRAHAAATMLYFAATISYEQARFQHRAAYGPTGFGRAFLCADDPALQQAARQALATLRAWPNTQSPDAEAVCQFEGQVEAAIRPYNTAGLFHPDVPNMYHHTAIPL